MKRLIALLIALFFSLAIFAGCGKKEEPKQAWKPKHLRPVRADELLGEVIAWVAFHRRIQCPGLRSAISLPPRSAS